MPKAANPPPIRHANSAQMNQWLQGVWQSSVSAVKCCKTVACPRCKANQGWPCSSATGNDSSTPHSARWEAYRAAQADNA